MFVLQPGEAVLKSGFLEDPRFIGWRIVVQLGYWIQAAHEYMKGLEWNNRTQILVAVGVGAVVLLIWGFVVYSVLNCLAGLCQRKKVPKSKSKKD